MTPKMDEIKPEISIIIPCYNSGATIARAVNSCVAQTWISKEIIVIDDGSDDPKTIEELDDLSSIKLIRQANHGLPSARNCGVKHAKGTWIMFLDADDWLEENAICELIKPLKGTQEVYSFPYLRLQGNVKGVLEKQYNFFEQLFLNQLPYCLMISKDAFLRLGGYDETMRSGYEDWELNIRLGESGIHGHLVAQPLVNYQVSNNGMLLSKSVRQHAQLWREIRKKNRQSFKLRRMLSSWQYWKGQKSSYPLSIYPFLFLFHVLLPDFLFNRVFLIMRKFSKSNRMQSARECVE